MTLTTKQAANHTRTEVLAENIPDELKAYDHWVCWRYENEKGRWKKPPIDCQTGRMADLTDPLVQVPFEEAYDYYRNHLDVHGIGFVFTPDGPYSGIDLDECRDPQSGVFVPEAEDIIRDIGSYGEVSPSGTGAKMFVRGKLPPGGRRRTDKTPWDGNVEIYSSDSYFTVTGRHLPQTPTTVEERQDALLKLYHKTFGGSGGTLADQDLLAKAKSAANGKKFARLWDGDTSDYPSDSEADQALCRLLAFWTEGNARRVEHLFGLSTLGQRDKWREREDYRERTIRTALKDQNGFYQAPARTDRPNEAPDDPHRLARLFVEARRHPDGLTLHYWRDQWHRWNGRAYEVVPETEVRANLCDAVKAEFDRVNVEELKSYARRKKKGKLQRGETRPAARHVTKSLLGNVLQALTGPAVIPASTEQPTWLNGDGRFPADEVLAAADGLVHLPTLTSRPPTPNFFSPAVLDYAFDPAAPPPRAWLDFLRQLWPDDRQSVETLQDWFGYCLLPDTRQQKMLLLVGPKRSGKGTIARVLKAVVGARNVAGPTLSSLATQFGLEPLVGKTVAVVSDARLSGRADGNIIAERLLSISGEDALTVDRKHLPAVHVKFPTRFLILTNELQRVNDSSGALASRMLLLRMDRSFYGQEDPCLTDRLLAELPGILLWAVEGWRRLRDRKHFLQPESGQEMRRDLEDLGSPVSAFIRDRCVVGPDKEVAKAELYQEWTAWCMGEGRHHAGDAATFGRDLIAAQPGIRSCQPREGRRRKHTYRGIGVAGR